MLPHMHNPAVLRAMILMILFASSAVAASGDTIQFKYLGSMGGTVRHQVRHGKIMAVSMGSCIELLDRSTSDTRRLSRIWLRGSVTDLDFAGNALYAAVKNNDIQMIDVSNPAKPVVRGSYEPENATGMLYYYEVVAENNRLKITGHYRHSYKSVEIADISKPFEPKQIETKGNDGSEDDEDEKKDIVVLPANYQEPKNIDLPDPLPPGAEAAVIDGGFAYHIDANELVVFDLGNPDRITEMKRIALKNNSEISSPTKINNPLVLYRRDPAKKSNEWGGWYYLFDQTDPKNPVCAASIETTRTLIFDWPRTMLERAPYDYSADDTSSSLAIYDIGDPRRPQKVGEIVTPHQIHQVEIRDHRAYIACLDLMIVDISDPARPKLESQIKFEGSSEEAHVKYDYDGFRATSVDLCDSHVYCGDICVDVSDIKSPKIAADNLFAEPSEIGANVHERSQPCRVYGKWGLQSFEATDHDEETISTRLNIFDLSDPPRPRRVASIEGCKEEATIVGNRLYLGSEASGLVALELQPAPAREPNKYFRRIAAMPEGPRHISSISEVKIAGDLACVSSKDGVYTVNIADPAHPKLLGEHEMSDDLSDRAMAIDRDLLFVESSQSVNVVDISNPAAPEHKNTFDTKEPIGTMAANNGILYVLGQNKWLGIYGIPDAGTVNARLPYTASAECSDMTTSGSTIYLAAEGLEIVDASNPAAPKQLSRLPFPMKEEHPVLRIKRLAGAVYLIRTPSRFEKTTQTTVSIIDVSDPGAPKPVGEKIAVSIDDLGKTPSDAELKSIRPSKYSGWLLGVPVGDYAKKDSPRGMLFYDLTDPFRPVFAGGCDGLNTGKPVLYKTRVYLAEGESGLVTLQRAK